MFAPSSVENLRIWSLAGWTMLHFLWLGTLVGLVAVASGFIVRRRSPEARYAVAISNFVVLALLPVAIVAWLISTSAPVALSVPPALGDEIVELHQPATLPNTATGASELERAAGAIELSAMDSALVPELPALRQSLELPVVEALAACVAYLPWLWLVGTPLTMVLLTTGIIGAERLRRASERIESGPLADACVRLRKSLGISRDVAVAVCERIAAPVLVGILRPIILLPPAALTGWSPDEIEMVLLHELAHVRRWDNCVNLVQRLVESLLFFHPAVWLVSRWVRREREACCDALVVRRTNRPHAYAEMLVALAAQLPRSVLDRGRGRPGSLVLSSMAAGPLRTRIRRILQLEDDPMLVSGKSFTLVIGALVVAGTLAVLNLPAVGQAEESAADTTAEISQEPPLDKSSTEAADDNDVLIAEELRLDVPEGDVVITAEEDRVKVNTVPRPSSSKTERVVVAYPDDQFSSSPDIILKEIDQARKRNEYVDLKFRNGNVELIATVPPAEADWPAILGDSPRKERVIADSAWERLGLKLVPASQLEQLEFQLRGTGGMIKILGGNVPKGLKLPAFLRRIGNQRLDSFDELLAWLNNQGRGRAPLKAYVWADGHDYLFDAGPAMASAPPNTAPTSKPQPAKFPSLEDQKLADEAWRMLQLELEPLAAADLRRVQQLGYDGGVRIAAVGDTSLQQGNISQSEILVGLHVWPTRNMKEVVEILSRDDLTELNPLKFYVVSTEMRGDELGEARVVDVVHTGRINARTDRRRASADRGARTFGGNSSSALPRYTTPTPNSSTNAPPTVTTIETPAEAKQSNSNRPKQADPQLPSASQETLAMRERRRVQLTNLRYDGKSFNQWRDIWRNELSTERRLEAVKALAAFAAAGYGPQAAEAILEIAGEYDFRTFADRDSAEGQLRTQIVRTLASGKGVDPTDVFDKIAKLYDGSPPKYHGLLAQFLARLPKLDASVLDRIRALRKHTEADIRAAALAAVVANDPAQISEYICEALTDPEPLVVTMAIEIVGRQEESAAKLVGPLTEMLNDPSRADNHLAVIRALGRMRQKAAAAQPDLERIFNDSQDPRLRVAAAYALDQVGRNRSPRTRYRNKLLSELNRPPSDDREERERQEEKRDELTRLINEEQRLMQ